MLGVLALTAFSYGLVVAIRGQLIGLDPFAPQATRQQVDGYVYASDGHTILAVLRGSQSRVLVQSAQISPWIKQAIVATEDRRFYEHRGIDLRGMARALWADVRHKSALQGGSTITQQFVKNELTGSQRSITRKLKEAALAWQLEQRWTKDQILTAYLNTIYFGNGAYGVERAARTYFGHDALKLTLPEAALLAGIPEDPSRYDPVAHPRAAIARRKVVLRLMLQQGIIQAARYQRAARAPLPKPQDVHLSGIRGQAPYFGEYVKQQLIDQFGAKRVFGGGFRVDTTINLQLQKLARAAIDKWLPSPDGPQAALVAINPSNGAVLTMMGGRSFHESQFNLAVQGERQPGSSFKPFVLATALKEGISPLSDVHLQAHLDLPRQQVLDAVELRRGISRADRPREGDRGVRQLRLRAADEGRRPGERRENGPRAWHHEPARRRVLDRARHAGGQPARDGARLRDVRERRLSNRRQGVRRRAARDHEDPERQG